MKLSAAKNLDEWIETNDVLLISWLISWLLFFILSAVILGLLYSLSGTIEYNLSINGGIIGYALYVAIMATWFTMLTVVYSWIMD